MLIGVLGDTHLPTSIRDPWPEVAEAFRGVDLILHSGDIVSHRVLDWLERIAPVLAALGNNDFDMDDPRVKPTQILEAEGWTLGMLHDITSGVQLDRPVDILVTGHTHYEQLEYANGVVEVNPGSPTLPHHQSTRLGTVGILDLNSERLKASIVRLGDGPMARGALLVNPGRELHLEVPRSALAKGG